MDDDGLTLGPSASWLRWLIPTYRAPWSSVVGASPAKYLSTGVRFELNRPVAAEQRAGLARLWPQAARQPVFWCTARQRDEILDECRARVADGPST